jgi:hypothetical protein
VPGYIFKEKGLKHELWGGLGLVVVDDSQPALQTPDPEQQRYYAAAPLFAEIRNLVVEREEDADARRTGEMTALRERVRELEEEIEALRRDAHLERTARAGLERSISWRVTRPLRSAKTLARRRMS